MNGRDAAGRAVSLLNHEPSQCVPRLAPAPSPLALSTKVSPWPRASPTTIPPTPELLRSSSSSSQRTNDSPSPTTPAHLFEPRLQIKTTLSTFAADPAPAVQLHHSPQSAYPLLSPQIDASDLGSADSSRSIGSLSPPASPGMTVSAKPMPKKYPCQFADRLGCREMFTTSGHASRHAKKHTGEKNVQCPKCSKKFARKDNMKQHLKTHDPRGGDGSSASAEERPRAAKVARRGDGQAVAIRTLESSAHRPAPDAGRTRPQLHRAVATFSVPQQAYAAFEESSVAAGHHASSALTPGIEALLIAAEQRTGYELGC